MTFKISKKINTLILGVFCMLPLLGYAEPSEPVTADAPAAIEQLKTDIINLNAEFRNLEQEYLYPASVDAALFISVDAGQYFTLEAIEAQINDQPIVGHFYTEQQRQALAKGGIQKLRQLNLKPGQHQLVITIIGKDAEGNSIKRGLVHSFTKTSASLGLELQLIDSARSLSVEPKIKTWTL